MFSKHASLYCTYQWLFVPKAALSRGSLKLQNKWDVENMFFHVKLHVLFRTVFFLSNDFFLNDFFSSNVFFLNAFFSQNAFFSFQMIFLVCSEKIIKKSMFFEKLHCISPRNIIFSEILPKLSLLWFWCFFQMLFLLLSDFDAFFQMLFLHLSNVDVFFKCFFALVDIQIFFLMLFSLVKKAFKFLQLPRPRSEHDVSYWI